MKSERCANPTSIDATSKVLQSLRLRESFYCRCDLSAPWALEVPESRRIGFHILLDGQCELHLEDKTWHLKAGSVAMIPHGRRHVLATRGAGEPESVLTLASVKHGDTGATLDHGGGGATSVLICGALQFETHPLLAQLPEALVVDSVNSPAWLTATFDALLSEALEPRAGSSALVNQLSDALITGTVRAWLERQEHGEEDAWFMGLEDAAVARSLALMHEAPGEAWTVERLASTVHLSRTAFAQRFAKALRTTPMQYLHAHRMTLAARWLREGRESLSAISSRIGYSSESAFGRAFNRHFGEPPGRFRDGAK
ncbi:MAG: AraC family transcriptional regulator [Myxococcota bacterium]